MSILETLASEGIEGFVDGNQRVAPKWEQCTNRLLVGTIKLFRVYAKDDTNNVSLELENHDGQTYTLYHAARMGYALCRLAGVRTGSGGWAAGGWSDYLNEDDFSSLVGQTLIIHYQGQSTEKNQPHLFAMFLNDQSVAGPVFNCEQTYDALVAANPELIVPIEKDPGEDSDL